ncbi:(S)-sulfolactate dehydrogenase [Kyrpidia spormannii]|uniref:(S)-sulfolactate dehydrogenase n=1 Tax=Kyrpidia spormannii TaxID=2055160 RepID=A0ACA8Z9D0_9BACL|nr:(S)-sulfolactate dehydrogenase [Kyrpidia spormannii]
MTRSLAGPLQFSGVGDTVVVGGNTTSECQVIGMKIVVSEWMEEVGLRRLAEYGQVMYDPDLWRSRYLWNEVREAEALIVRNQIQVTDELLGAGERLRVIGRLGVGLDNIDLEAAGRRGVQVVVARNANAISVAEYVFSAMLHWIRPLLEASEDVKTGHWNRRRFTTGELYGKTLGLVGLGEIGTRLAIRAKCFGMQVTAYDPYVAPFDMPPADLGVSMCPSLEDLLASADFVSLHLPLTRETYHMINYDAFARMKPTAVLINTARGGVVDEEALVTALRQGLLGGAVLDVLEHEPPDGSPLFHEERVILTPHIAGLTEESQDRVSRLVAEEVIRVLRGERSNCVVRGISGVSNDQRGSR